MSKRLAIIGGVVGGVFLVVVGVRWWQPADERSPDRVASVAVAGAPHVDAAGGAMLAPEGKRAFPRQQDWAPGDAHVRAFSAGDGRSRAQSSNDDDPVDLEQQWREEDEQHAHELEVAALHADDPQARIAALDDLTSLDAERSRGILVRAASDKDAQVRVSALSQLSTIFGSDAPFDPIAQAAQDGDPEVRSEALKALDSIDDPRKAAIIRAALKDPDEDVRSWAEFYAATLDDDGTTGSGDDDNNSDDAGHDND